MWYRPNVFDESRLDVVIIKELGKRKETPSKELVCEVDGRVHDTKTVRSDGVGNVTNIDCVQMLIRRRFLDENLVIQIVQVLGHKHMDVSHNFQNIKALFESLRWQIHVLHL